MVTKFMHDLETKMDHANKKEDIEETTKGSRLNTLLK